MELTKQIEKEKIVDFLGIRINNLTSNEILDRIDICIAKRTPVQVVGLNVDQAVRVLEDEYSKKIFNDAEIVFTDGKPILWIAKKLGHPIVEKVSGPDLMYLLCERAAEKGYKIFLLGAGPGVAEKAAENLKNKYSGLNCVGTYSPPFGFEKDEAEMEKIINMLKESGADQLFVGMGSPKQDIFIYENMEKYNIPVSYSMGAALDFIGGSVKRAPKWMCDHGLEWFHRFLHNPKRLFKRYFVDDLRILKYYRKYKKQKNKESRESKKKNKQSIVKVLVVESTKYGFDGISNVIANYYTYIDHGKIDMDIVTPNPITSPLIDRINENGNQNFVIPCRNRNPLKYLIQLRKILKVGKYDIIHVHGCSSIMAIEMLAGVLAGVKVRIAHSHNTKCDHKFFDKLFRPLFSLLCNARFACGQEAGEWLFKKKDFKIISNGVSTEKLKFNAQVRDEFRKKYGLDDKFVVGHVGRFSEQKNHKKLIGIFEELSKKVDNAKLVLVGDGELKTEIMTLSEQKGLDVLFVGNSNEINCWLQAMDIMVFPSLFEGVPLGLIEAQAACLPCLISDTISPMTKVSDILQFEGLNETNDKWAENAVLLQKSIDREAKYTAVIEQIKLNGYEIENNVINLENIYEKLANGVKE